jgi:hypothetical protein
MEMDFDPLHEANMVMNANNPFVGAAIPVSMIMMPTPMFDNAGLTRIPAMHSALPLYMGE